MYYRREKYAVLFKFNNIQQTDVYKCHESNERNRPTVS